MYPDAIVQSSQDLSLCNLVLNCPPGRSQNIAISERREFGPSAINTTFLLY